jgi:hypothetical protein
MLEPCGSMARSGKINRMELELTRKFQKQARQVPGVRYVQGNWKRNIGTVRAGLVPSLNSCSDGAKDYSQVEGKRLPPPMPYLISQGFTLGVFEVLNLFEGRRVLGDKSTSTEEWFDVPKALGISEFVNVTEKSRPRDVCQWILNPTYEQLEGGGLRRQEQSSLTSQHSPDLPLVSTRLLNTQTWSIVPALVGLWAPYT